MANKDDVDVDAVARLRAATLGMKAQADELLTAGQSQKALQLYRELLVHLTRSRVTQLEEAEMVLSCRLNVLAALCRDKKWGQVVQEADETLQEFEQLRGAMQGSVKANILARAHYFRGFALFQQGSFVPAQQDFKRAMEINPEDEQVQSHWKELETAIQTEDRVKQHLATSMKLFQTGQYQGAVENCMDALRESQLLRKTELTGMIHGNLAAIYVKAKDDAKAIEHYKRTMLLTRTSNPSTAQNERVFDILDSLAGCYSRKRDYSSALSVVEDQMKMLSLCPDRKDREAIMYLNGGRICYTVGKFNLAEEHLEKGYAAATTANQTEVGLNCAYWLSKSYAKNGKTDDAIKILDGSIPKARKEVGAGKSADVLEKLLVARLDLLDPGLTGSILFDDPQREAQLWDTLEYFDKKHNVYGHLRAAQASVNFFQTKGNIESRENREAVLRALSVVNQVNIGKLPTSEAPSFMRLAMLKVELLMSSSATGRQDSKLLLVKVLQDLELPGRADPSCRRQLQQRAFSKLISICATDTEEDSNSDTCAFLEEAVRVLDEDHIKASSDVQASLKVLLPRIARRKASRGDFRGAENVLDKHISFLRGDSDATSERLCEALVGLCVMRIRLGMMAEAAATMKEIETLPVDEKPKELSVIKIKLEAAVREAQKRKQRETGKTDKSFLMSSKQGQERSSSVCGLLHDCWGRWCGALLVCAAAIAVCLVLG